MSILLNVASSKSAKRLRIPSDESLCLASSFTLSEISGMSDKPLVSAEKYNPVPPTIIGVGLFSKISLISRSQCPTGQTLSLWAQGGKNGLLSRTLASRN
jgi:hypothetical protein